MSNKANPTTIGLFVIAGLALGVAGVLLFGSSRLFVPTQRAILYFDSSLQGLNPGAAVKFRGVTIGSVREVFIRFNQASNDFHMPVLIEIREDLVRERMGEKEALSGLPQIESAVQRGMRGILKAESLVTGVLYVELDERADVPAVFHQVQRLYPEIPTAHAEIQEVLAKLARLDVVGVFDKLNSVLARLDASLAELRVRDINAGLTNMLASLNKRVNAPELTNAVTSAHKALDEVRKLAEKLSGRVDPAADELGATLKEGRQALAEMRQAVQDVRDAIAPDAALRLTLTQALEQIGEAAHSIAALADYLARNPNALLAGKKRPESKP